MLRIDCPFCGLRDHAEFRYGGDATIIYPPLEAAVEVWIEAVFWRENPCGRQLESWQHVHGCRLWLYVERDTATHTIYSVRAAAPNIAALFSPPNAPSVTESTLPSPKRP